MENEGINWKNKYFSFVISDDCLQNASNLKLFKSLGINKQKIHQKQRTVKERFGRGL
jgi:hypothetical protein